MEKLNKFFNIKCLGTVLKNVLFIGIVALGVLSILEGILFHGIMKVKTEYNMIFIMILVCLILNLILSCIIFQVVSKITRGFTDKALKSLEKIQSGDLSFSLGEYDVAGMCLPRQLKILLEIADPSHLFYGSDYPYTPEAGCIMLAEDLDKTEILTEELRKDIYYNNALKLFPRLIK